MQPFSHKTTTRVLTLIAALFITSCATQPQQARYSLSRIASEINDHWWFAKVDSPQTSEAPKKDISWEVIRLPHDWSITDMHGKTSPFDATSIDAYDTGYTTGGRGWYRKSFYLPPEAENKTAILTFGGVYMNSSVFVNDKLVGGQHNGYTSFWIDITDALKPNDHNTIEVKVNNNHLNSRWYSGSGIYRPVTLQFKSPVHFSPWGTTVTTTQVSENSAQIQISSNIGNRSINDNFVTVKTQLLDTSNKVVYETERKQRLNLDHVKLYSQVTLKNPSLWSPETPNLYRVKQQIFSQKQLIEEQQTSFGIRNIIFSATHGLLINKKPTLLKGMNLHHDNYLLGAVAHPKAEIRKVKKILEAGYNAVRTSHNPPSKAFLNAADKYGLLVISEAFDTWNKKKWDHKNDYSSHFTTDWKRDLTNFIKRDINHPAIIMWSLGNEIPEQRTQLGTNTAKQLATFAKQLDPTRPLTIGANYSGKDADSFLNTFDVVGYNYQEANYLSDQQRNPSRVMYGSETYSARAFEYWQYAEKHPFVIGDFVWTGWDYIGEASLGWTGYAPEWKGLADYPWNLAYCGEIDATGRKRPSAYYRDVLWNTGKNKVSAFVRSPSPSLQPLPNKNHYRDWVQPDLHPNWTWPGYEGEPLDVVAYSRYENVALELNGVEIARKPTSVNTEYRAQFRVNYTPGQLLAVGYSNGVRQEAWALTTTNKPASVSISAEEQTITADGRDITFISAQLLDNQGNPVYLWDYDIPLTFTVKGAATLLALGNANPTSIESFKRNTRTTFRGTLIAVVQAKKHAGNISIMASSQGITSNTLVLKAAH